MDVLDENVGRLSFDGCVLQADELYKICSIMGSPTAATWPEGLVLAASMGFRFPQCQPTPLAAMVRSPFIPPMTLCML